MTGGFTYFLGVSIMHIEKHLCTYDYSLVGTKGSDLPGKQYLRLNGLDACIQHFGHCRCV